MIQVTYVVFSRKETPQKTEEGIMINGDQLIIDAEGKPVKAPVWNYNTIPCRGNVNFYTSEELK